MTIALRRFRFRPKLLVLTFQPGSKSGMIISEFGDWPKEKQIALGGFAWHQRGYQNMWYPCQIAFFLGFDPHAFWIGLECPKTLLDRVWRICILPCLPITIRFDKSSQGIFP